MDRNVSEMCDRNFMNVARNVWPKFYECCPKCVTEMLPKCVTEICAEICAEICPEICAEIFSRENDLNWRVWPKFLWRFLGRVLGCFGASSWTHCGDSFLWQFSWTLSGTVFGTLSDTFSGTLHLPAAAATSALLLDSRLLEVEHSRPRGRRLPRGVEHSFWRSYAKWTLLLTVLLYVNVPCVHCVSLVIRFRDIANTLLCTCLAQTLCRRQNSRWLEKNCRTKIQNFGQNLGPYVFPRILSYTYHPIRTYVRTYVVRTYVRTYVS